MHKSLIAIVATLALLGCWKKLSPFYGSSPEVVGAAHLPPRLDGCPNVIGAEFLSGPNGQRCVAIHFDQARPQLWCVDDEVGL